MDTRWRGRAVKQFGPLWPLAYELALMGTPIGVFVERVGSAREWRVVTVDVDGELWELRRLGSRPFSVRWCLNRSLRVHRTLGELLDALCAGFVAGWVPGCVVEVKGPASWLVSGVRYAAL